MKPKLLILDTSVLCVYLNIPGKETCDGEIQLTHESAIAIIQEKQQAGWQFVLPVACAIETGNHIAQCGGNRYDLATQLVSLIKQAIAGESPWIIFSANLDIWKPDNLGWLDDWASHAAAKLSIADRTISFIADDYSTKGYEVEIFTCDEQLKAHQPAQPKLPLPRRRR